MWVSKNGAFFFQMTSKQTASSAVINVNSNQVSQQKKASRMVAPKKWFLEEWPSPVCSTLMEAPLLRLYSSSMVPFPTFFFFFVEFPLPTSAPLACPGQLHQTKSAKHRRAGLQGGPRMNHRSAHETEIGFPWDFVREFHGARSRSQHNSLPTGIRMS